MIRRPPRSTLFPTRRSSDLGADHAPRTGGSCAQEAGGKTWRRSTENLARRRCHHRRPALRRIGGARRGDRKSTRLNSSHQIISYAVFCLKKKKINIE